MEITCYIKKENDLYVLHASDGEKEIIVAKKYKLEEARELAQALLSVGKVHKVIKDD